MTDKKGAIVVLDIYDNSLLTLYSAPSYDLNVFTPYLNEAEQAVQLSLDEEKAEVKAFTMVCSMQTVSCTVIKPKPIIIKMDHPYFVVVKDKTSDGISRIVCAAWISNPK